MNCSHYLNEDFTQHFWFVFDDEGKIIRTGFATKADTANWIRINGL